MKLITKIDNKVKEKAEGQRLKFIILTSEGVEQIQEELGQLRNIKSDHCYLIDVNYYRGVPVCICPCPIPENFDVVWMKQ